MTLSSYVERGLDVTWVTKASAAVWAADVICGAVAELVAGTSAVAATALDSSGILRLDAIVYGLAP